jgi:excisionase family DNA binding protein
MNEDRLLKLAEVRQRLGVSRSTVWRWMAERGLKVVSIGNVTRIREIDLQAFLTRHESGGRNQVGVAQSQIANGARPQTSAPSVE